MLNIGKAAERLEENFEQILGEADQGGASLSLWKGEECLLSLHGGESSPGRPWNRDTPCLIWSASKGLAAACTLHALQEHGIGLDTTVASLWTEFGAAGKERITLGHVLAHQAGLAAIDTKALPITDHGAVAAALAAQPPNWNLYPQHAGEHPPVHGYGARTLGFLLDEIVRRTAGESLASYWRRFFGEPMGLDLWFGLPEERVDSAATVIAPKVPPAPSTFTRAFGDPASLTRRALSEPGGTLTPSLMNTPAMRRASIPSLGAIGTADALACFYALLAGGGAPCFNGRTITAMTTTRALGGDLVLMEDTAFSAGFMTNAHGVYGPSPGAFGHPGAGGALGFADPEAGIGFAFVPSTMHPGALPGPRTRKLVRALYGIPDPE